MPKYLFEASYTLDGARGVIKDGGTKRRAAVEAVLKSPGGRLEAFYFAYGEYDAYVITDFPDPNIGVALSLAVNASGAVKTSLVPLITPEEMDSASKRTVAYKAPGA